MTKLLPVLILVLMLLQILFLPAATQANSAAFCPYFTNLLISDVTNTTAVFTGSLCFAGVPLGPTAAAAAGNINSLNVNYGTSPGVFPYRAESKTFSGASVSGQSGVAGSQAVCYSFRFNLYDLVPCTLYYLQYGYDIGVCGWANQYLTFKTTGCQVGSGSHQSGGVSGFTQANPTQLSNIIVQKAAISQPGAVAPGEKVNITATVTNRGVSNGTAKITLYINGQEAESKGVAVSSGQTMPVDFTVSQNEPGAYAVYVNGVSAGSFVVDAFTNNDALIYGIIALFTLGIAGALYLLVRRRTA